MMKRMICTALAALILLSAGGCGSGGNVPELLEPVSVNKDLAEVRRGELCDGVVWEASAVPRTEELCFASGGRVGEVCVLLGDRVKKGDPLIRLDTAGLEERREALEEELEYARTMDEFSSREAELNRRAIAQQSGYYSGRYQFYDNEQEQAAHQRAENIARMEEELAELEEDLNVNSVIAAPFDGTVVALNLSVGGVAEPEETAAVVASDSVVYLQTNFINEKNLSYYDEVYATVGGTRYEVSFVPIDVQEYIRRSAAEKAMYVYFNIKGATRDLVGQYALLYLISHKREDALIIPANALLRDAKGYYVYVEGSGGQERRSVEIGVKSLAQAEVLSGLEEGEMVHVVN